MFYVYFPGYVPLAISENAGANVVSQTGKAVKSFQKF